MIDIGKSLQKLHLSTPAIGGIALTYTSMGGVAMVGVIMNKQTGFSTTMRFIDQEGQHTTTLHGASILIGRPEASLGFSGSTRFTPHVFVRNNTNQPVEINPRIRYTLFDQPNTVSLATTTLSANEVRELNLGPAINAIGDNIASDTGIEIDHGGSPGAVMVYAASIDQSGSNVFDVPIKDPKSEMGFKGGSYPWNIDGDNRAVLHVKNVDVPGDAKKREFMVKLYFDGGEYYLPLQSLEAGQTMEVDIKKLRDDQIRDDLGNVIPLNVTSGQLNWYGRAKRGEFIGRLVQYDPVTGISSSFSCLQSCQCDLSFYASWLAPSSFQGGVGDSFHIDGWELDADCNGFPFLPYRVSGVLFSTTNPFVVDVFGNTALLTGGGNAYIIGEWDAYIVTERPDPTCEIDIGEGPCPHVCDVQLTTASGATSVSVQGAQCNTPTGESTTSAGWADSDGFPTVHKWMQTLAPSGTNFGGRVVSEADPGGGQDNCYFSGSAIPPQDHVTGFSWTVNPDNTWGPDYVGFTPFTVNYYRSQGRAPCGTIVPQRMDIFCNTRRVAYSITFPSLAADIQPLLVTSRRAEGQTSRIWP